MAKRKRRKSPPSEAELAIRFKPGQSGNPKGRPAGSVSVGDAIRRELNTIINVETKRRKVDEFAEMCVLHAMGGDARYAQIILDRIDGPITIEINQTTIQATLGNLTDAQLDRLIAVARRDELAAAKTRKMITHDNDPGAQGASGEGD